MVTSFPHPSLLAVGALTRIPLSPRDFALRAFPPRLRRGDAKHEGFSRFAPTSDDRIPLSPRDFALRAFPPRLRRGDAKHGKNGVQVNLTPFFPCFAEREGFEPPEAFTSTVFKTAGLNHSPISPSLWFGSAKIY